MSMGESAYDRINDYGAVRIGLASPHDIRSWSLRRGQEAGDDQLPHLPPREGRPVLRADLRARKGLGVRLRQVPRHEVQGDDLRPLRRQGHAQPRPPQAHGPHRAGRARRPHLVLQGDAQPPRHPARHEDHQPGKDHLLPGLRRHRPRRHPAQGTPAPHRGRVPQGPRAVRRHLPGRHGRRGRQQAARAARPGRALEAAPPGARPRPPASRR